MTFTCNIEISYGFIYVDWYVNLLTGQSQYVDWVDQSTGMQFYITQYELAMWLVQTVMFCYQTKYEAQQQQIFLLILIYSSRYVQLQSGRQS